MLNEKVKMEIIYKITNLINKKSYIGQTNDIQKRINGHKSNATNKKCHSYTLPFCSAIRKYGWNNFSVEVLETYEDDDKEKEIEWANEREEYYISLFHTLTSENGYNISHGGGQSPKGKMSFEEKVSLSRFTLEEAKDIQTMLISGTERSKILSKYPEKLTDSYLDNINAGTNLFNDSLTYPLHDYFHDEHYAVFTKEERQLIKNDISSGMFYSEISKKWNISIGMISTINNGSMWWTSDDTYPLCIKGCSRLYNWTAWVKEVIFDLENSDLNLIEISKKYNKSYSTIKKINEGCSYRDANKKYPLTKYRKK